MKLNNLRLISECLAYIPNLIPALSLLFMWLRGKVKEKIQTDFSLPIIRNEEGDFG